MSGPDVAMRAALAPDEGEVVADVFYRTEPHPLAPKLAPDASGLIWLPHEAFGAAFAQNASWELQEWLPVVQRPIAVPCISTPVGRSRWKDVPSWYLLAEDDRMIIKETQAFMAERMKTTVICKPVDHTPSVTAPVTVVDAALAAAKSIRWSSAGLHQGARTEEAGSAVGGRDRSPRIQAVPRAACSLCHPAPNARGAVSAYCESWANYGNVPPPTGREDGLGFRCAGGTELAGRGGGVPHHRGR